MTTTCLMGERVSPSWPCAEDGSLALTAAATAAVSGVLPPEGLLQAPIPNAEPARANRNTVPLLMVVSPVGGLSPAARSSRTLRASARRTHAAPRSPHGA